MIEWDDQCGFEVTDRRQQQLGVHRVLAHHGPFRLIERSRLEQDAVGHAHLADVVQDGAALEAQQLFAGQPHAFRQPNRVRHHALGVPLRLMIAQIERARPTAQRRVVGQDHLAVRALQVLDELRVDDRDRGLARQGLEIVAPGFIWM